jgi:hypothetical protein
MLLRWASQLCGWKHNHSPCSLPEHFLHLVVAQAPLLCLEAVLRSFVWRVCVEPSLIFVLLRFEEAPCVVLTVCRTGSVVHVGISQLSLLHVVVKAEVLSQALVVA